MKNFESSVRKYALSFFLFAIVVLSNGIGLAMLKLNGRCTITLPTNDPSTSSIVASVCALSFFGFLLVRLLIWTPKKIAEEYTNTFSSAEEHYKAIILLLACMRENNTQCPVSVSDDLKEYLHDCYANEIRDEFGGGIKKPSLASYEVQVSKIMADRIELSYTSSEKSLVVDTKNLPLNERTVITKCTMLQIDESYAEAQFNL